MRHFLLGTIIKRPGCALNVSPTHPSRPQPALRPQPGPWAQPVKARRTRHGRTRALAHWGSPPHQHRSARGVAACGEQACARRATRSAVFSPPSRGPQMIRRYLRAQRLRYGDGGQVLKKTWAQAAIFSASSQRNGAPGIDASARASDGSCGARRREVARSCSGRCSTSPAWSDLCAGVK